MSYENNQMFMNSKWIKQKKMGIWFQSSDSIYSIWILSKKYYLKCVGVHGIHSSKTDDHCFIIISIFNNYIGITIKIVIKHDIISRVIFLDF